MSNRNPSNGNNDRGGQPQPSTSRQPQPSTSRQSQQPTTSTPIYSPVGLPFNEWVQNPVNLNKTVNFVQLNRNITNRSQQQQPQPSPQTIQNQLNNTTSSSQQQNTTSNTSTSNQQQNTTSNTSTSSQQQNTTSNTSTSSQQQNATSNTSTSSQQQNTTSNTSTSSQQPNTTSNTSTSSQQQSQQQPRRRIPPLRLDIPDDQLTAQQRKVNDYLARLERSNDLKINNFDTPTLPPSTIRRQAYQRIYNQYPQFLSEMSKLFNTSVDHIERIVDGILFDIFVNLYRTSTQSTKVRDEQLIILTEELKYVERKHAKVLARKLLDYNEKLQEKEMVNKGLLSELKKARTKNRIREFSPAELVEINNLITTFHLPINISLQSTEKFKQLIFHLKSQLTQFSILKESTDRLNAEISSLKASLATCQIELGLCNITGEDQRNLVSQMENTIQQSMVGNQDATIRQSLQTIEELNRKVNSLTDEINYIRSQLRENDINGENTVEFMTNLKTKLNANEYMRNTYLKIIGVLFDMASSTLTFLGRDITLEIFYEYILNQLNQFQYADKELPNSELRDKLIDLFNYRMNTINLVKVRNPQLHAYYEERQRFYEEQQRLYEQQERLKAQQNPETEESQSLDWDNYSFQQNQEQTDNIPPAINQETLAPQTFNIAGSSNNNFATSTPKAAAQQNLEPVEKTQDKNLQNDVPDLPESDEDEGSVNGQNVGSITITDVVRGSNEDDETVNGQNVGSTRPDVVSAFDNDDDDDPDDGQNVGSKTGPNVIIGSDNEAYLSLEDETSDGRSIGALGLPPNFNVKQVPSLGKVINKEGTGYLIENESSVTENDQFTTSRSASGFTPGPSIQFSNVNTVDLPDNVLKAALFTQKDSDEISSLGSTPQASPYLNVSQASPFLNAAAVDETSRSYDVTVINTGKEQDTAMDISPQKQPPQAPSSKSKNSGKRSKSKNSAKRSKTDGNSPDSAPSSKRSQQDPNKMDDQPSVSTGKPKKSENVKINSDYVGTKIHRAALEDEYENLFKADIQYGFDLKQATTEEERKQIEFQRESNAIRLAGVRDKIDSDAVRNIESNVSTRFEGFTKYI